MIQGHCSVEIPNYFRSQSQQLTLISKIRLMFKIENEDRNTIENLEKIIWHISQSSLLRILNWLYYCFYLIIHYWCRVVIMPCSAIEVRHNTGANIVRGSSSPSPSWRAASVSGWNTNAARYCRKIIVLWKRSFHQRTCFQCIWCYRKGFYSYIFFRI